MFRTLFIHLPSNVWRYRNWLANDADFAWVFLAEIMERKLRAMADCFERGKIVERWEEMVTECREAADILHRMRGGDTGLDRENRLGYTRYKDMTPAERRDLWDRVSVEEEADRRRFGELMAKLEWWWD